MPASEIDDIFAKKGKVQLASAPSIEHPEKKKKKKKKKKSDNAADAEEEQQRESPKSTTSKKRPAPETIIDESSLPIKKAKTTKLSGKKTGKDNQFFDSRGTGSRKKTEEGWAVYKEDELGINDTGGDTELCPFDCNCCF